MPFEPITPAQRLRGLDPSRLLGMLEGAAPTPPRIAGWEITGIAGRGGFGIVWAARNLRSGEKAAIKVAPAEEPDTLDRIEDEAAALSALDHPHIVRLLESGSLPDGAMYLAMQFIEGSNLAQHVPLGGMEPGKAFRLFRGIVSAVVHAHGHGLLHRDLKPPNVLLRNEPDGSLHPLVADFGLALPVHRRIQQLSLTQAGLIAGTAEYLPPEAYESAYRAEPGCDVYALGVILYEMLTGAPPRGAWRPVSEIKRVDIRFDSLLLRALHPNPQKRICSAEEFRREFEDILSSPPRYAGTPLVTRTIRVADCAWTILGMFTCLAALCVVLRLCLARIPMPIDLIGRHGLLAGGFQALFVILLLMLPVAIWQSLRLWRFRRIPLREALPAPFGVRLDTSRTAAALVFAGQVFCLFGPAALAFTTYSLVGRIWLTPEDPPWVHGLAVTQASRTKIVNPWQAPEPKVNYWLRESVGPPGHPLAVEKDRVDFYPRLIPILMVSASGVITITMLFTLLSAARMWWPRHRLRTVMTLGGASLATWGMASSHAAYMASGIAHRDPHRTDGWVMEAYGVPAGRIANELLREDFPHRPPFAADLLALYADEVDYRTHGRVSRARIAELIEEDRQLAQKHRRTTRTLRSGSTVKDRETHYTMTYAEFTDPPPNLGLPATISLCVLSLKTSLAPGGESSVISERLERHTAYAAEIRSLTPDEAIAWHRDFFAALARPGQEPDALIPLLYSVQLHEKVSDPAQARKRAVELRQMLIRTLRQHASIEPLGPPTQLESHPGGRWRIHFKVHDPTHQRDHRWSADLISVEGKWTAAQLTFES